MDLVERLEDTIDILQSDGWIRNRPFGPKGRCITGAWWEVNREANFPHELFYSATNCYYTPTSWNDWLAEDRHEVIATLIRMRNDAWREMYG